MGAGASGYNGTFNVKSIINDMEFTYEPGRNPGATATNDFNTKGTGIGVTEYPRFQRIIYSQTSMLIVMKGFLTTRRMFKMEYSTFIPLIQVIQSQKIY